MRKNGIYPELWKSGRDPVRHKLWLECQRNKAQAKYRGQEWQISMEEFIELWTTDDRYKRRGRGADNLCLTRINKNKPWHKDNVKFQTRREHFQEIYLGISHKTREIECKR